MRIATTTLLLLLCLAPIGARAQQTLDAHPPREGWSTGFIGAWRGDASVSIGAQFWNDYLHVRNLIARASLDIAPGLRAHAIARRREGSWSRHPLRPELDEAYLESMAFHRSAGLDVALDLKLGRVRYLRFPEPDRLSWFDQVPGIADMNGGATTDYRGALATAEVAAPCGLGAHFSAIQWALGSDRSGLNAIECYAFYRRALGSGWSVEGRAGGLAQRVQPLGLPARAGANAYVGKQVGEFEIGVMAEKLRGRSTTTGLMVRFRPTAVTRALGAVGFDYARSPEGAAVQVDVLHARINQGRQAGADEELVGEVHAVRMRTYWQQSFQRNEYEHRVSEWGIAAGPGVRCVVEEQPWRLDLEALVSPHTSPGRAWVRDRQGPAQLAQDVVYRFYRRR